MRAVTVQVFLPHDNACEIFRVSPAFPSELAFKFAGHEFSFPVTVPPRAAARRAQRPSESQRGPHRDIRRYVLRRGRKKPRHS